MAAERVAVGKVAVKEAANMAVLMEEKGAAVRAVADAAEGVQVEAETAVADLVAVERVVGRADNIHHICSHQNSQKSRRS